LLAQIDPDLTSRWRVLKPVFEQIRNDSLQALPIALNVTIIWNAGYQGGLVVFRYRLKQLAGTEDNLGEIDAA